MKHLIFLLLSFSCIQLIAQTNSPLTLEDKKMDTYLGSRKPAKLIVQIKNLPEQVKKVTITYTMVQLSSGLQISRYGETDATGLSALVLDQNLPYQQIWLSAGDYLYAGIYVNQGLTVTIDAQKVKSGGDYMVGNGVEYSGIDGELNTVMNKHTVFKQQEQGDLFDRLRNLREFKQKHTEEEFLLKADTIYKQLAQIDDEFIKAYPAYKWAVKNETSSNFYGNLCVLYWGENMPDKLFAQINNHVPYFTSNDGSLFYKYLQTYTTLKKYEQPLKGVDSYLAVFDRLYNPQRADLLKLFLMDNYKDAYMENYPAIISGIKTNWIKNITINQLTKANNTQKRVDSLFTLSKTLQTADIGKPLMKLPFEADLYQLDSVKNIDDFMLSLKSKFASKALIIDFWGTWCAPCLSDLPYSKSLHEQNKDLPIAYIYLCTTGGSTVDIWKKKVAELEIPGTHVFVNEKIIAQLKTALNAEGGFPSYVVVDANGKVNSKVISRMQALDRESVKKAVGL